MDMGPSLECQNGLQRSMELKGKIACDPAISSTRTAYGNKLQRKPRHVKEHINELLSADVAASSNYAHAQRDLSLLPLLVAAIASAIASAMQPPVARK